MMWFHDHAMAITRVNVHAGLAATYIVTDKYESGPARQPSNLPGPTDPGTVYLAFQDKIFFSATTETADPAWATLRADLIVDFSNVAPGTSLPVDCAAVCPDLRADGTTGKIKT